MIANVLYRFSIFADFQFITYNKQNIIKLLKVFDNEEFLPSVIQELLPTGVIAQRIQLIAKDGFSSITFLSERIDIQIIASRKEGFNNVEIKSNKDLLANYMKTIYDVFSDVIPEANRLAWIVDYVNFELTSEQKSLFKNRFQKELPFFKEGETEDMLIRYSAKKRSSVNNKEEVFNVITTIGKWLTNPQTELEIDGYKIEYDINTDGNNKKNRFDKESFDDFISKASAFQEEMNKEFVYNER